MLHKTMARAMRSKRTPALPSRSISWRLKRLLFTRLWFCSVVDVDLWPDTSQVQTWSDSNRHLERNASKCLFSQYWLKKSQPLLMNTIAHVIIEAHWLIEMDHNFAYWISSGWILHNIATQELSSRKCRFRTAAAIGTWSFAKRARFSASSGISSSLRPPHLTSVERVRVDCFVIFVLFLNITSLLSLILSVWNALLEFIKAAWDPTAQRGASDVLHPSTQRLLEIALVWCVNISCYIRSIEI